MKMLDQTYVHIDPELHREAFAAAKISGMSLNTWVAEAIRHEAEGGFRKKFYSSVRCLNDAQYMHCKKD